MFTESCDNKPDFVRRGNRYGLSGARQKKKCTQNTYQPFEFYSNSSHECHFSKSKCSEIGHISYNNGTAKEDTQCRCNYNTGYDYIKTPENKCYCVPSTEDCSCYIKKCNATERLSPDYKCTHMKVGSSQPHCPPDVYKRNKYEIGPINIIKKNGFSPQQLTKGPAIDLNISLNQDCSIKLTWKVPETKYKQSKYKIEYTYNDWKTTLELEKADINSYCRISHLAPYRTYHFHVTYFCMCDGVVIESISSDQKTIATSEKRRPFQHWNYCRIMMSEN
ncbi:Hypothetical predicted protein [Mytilus galloprovincialis]|uniref:Fibronectin type-III domain-containing protein n=1 Tax=Mytilus galloprovincialis TaxID=29158 RepID=A0A8B6C3F6_MYTGA|nr:Hypothetical predicted protein [Mytilus galloprovincialis]